MGQECSLGTAPSLPSEHSSTHSSQAEKDEASEDDEDKSWSDEEGVNKNDAKRKLKSRVFKKTLYKYLTNDSTFDDKFMMRVQTISEGDDSKQRTRGTGSGQILTVQVTRDATDATEYRVVICTEKTEAYVPSSVDPENGPYHCKIIEIMGEVLLLYM
eukprot:jgi/Bigna1/82226/fgenesh1_pg.89_\